MNDAPETQEFCSAAFIEDAVSRAKTARDMRLQAARETTDKLAVLASAICGRPVKVWSEAGSDRIRFELKFARNGAMLCKLDWARVEL